MTAPKLSLARPSSSPKSVKSAAAALTEGKARLVVDVPIEMHRKVKSRAATRGKSVRDYVMALIQADLESAT